MEKVYIDNSLLKQSLAVRKNLCALLGFKILKFKFYIVTIYSNMQ